jgi:hypothetical protein
MVERAALMLALSAALFLLWEYLALKRKGTQVPLWLGAFFVLTAIVFRVSSGVLGMVAAIYLFWPDETDTQRMIAGGAGFILGMWITAILIQVAQNLLRRFLGYPTRKIEWINGLKRK